MEFTSTPTITRARTARGLRPSHRYSALLFDWDGTLVDSQVANFTAMKQALEPHGVTLAGDWFAERVGLSSADLVCALIEEIGVPVPVDTVVRDYATAFLSHLHRVSLMPSTVKILTSSQGSFLNALATGGSAAAVLPAIAVLGLEDYFDTVVTRDDVQAGKPSPDIFLAAAARLGVPPAECLVYEDSREGLAAATAAGMDAIDVRPLRTPAML